MRTAGHSSVTQGRERIDMTGLVPPPPQPLTLQKSGFHGLFSRGPADQSAESGPLPRRQSPAGLGAGSRTVADGTLPPTAGRRSGLASRPGPQASTPQAGTGLIPGPEPRVNTARCPPRTHEGTAPGTGRRRWAGRRLGGTRLCAPGRPTAEHPLATRCRHCRPRALADTGDHRQPGPARPNTV